MVSGAFDSWRKFFSPRFGVPQSGAKEESTFNSGTHGTERGGSCDGVQVFPVGDAVDA
jgi:hypothetical protein